ncbi:hypothetical protein [Actinomadura fulvescens]|uniref:hypothetical protein n=1 Tax=Actinomadura fulvescens TaxID=46160 RepID=UPI0031DE7FCF
MTRDERAHQLAEAMAAYTRLMNTVRPASSGGKNSEAEIEQMRVDGDIIARAAVRARELEAEQNG